VQNFVYISPGSSLFSSLPGGDKTVKFHGKGTADFFTTLFSRLHGGHGQGVNCSHGDLSCILNALKAKRPDLFKNCNSQAQTNPISGLIGGDGILPSLNPWLGFSPWLFTCGEEGCSTAINPLFFFTFTYGTFGGGAFSF
jgi:hypothetical protein